MTPLQIYCVHRDAFASILDPRCYTIDWLDREVVQNAVEVIGDNDAAIIFEVRHFPAGARELHGLAAAGSLPSILALIRRAEARGRELECDFATIASRPGWQRALKDMGYDMHQVELRKELCDGA